MRFNNRIKGIREKIINYQMLSWSKKWGFLVDFKQFTIFSLLAPLPAFISNIMNSIYADNISILNIISTLIFLTSWMVYGFYVGYNRMNGFLLLNFVFWSLNIGIIIFHNSIAYIDGLYLLPIYVLIVPMYGLYYFVKQLNIGFHLISYCLLIIPILIFSIIGYLLGLIKHN